MTVTVTYVCGQTGQTVDSDSGMPEGWVVSTKDISKDIDKPVPERFTVIAFSSEKALKSYSDALLQQRMMSLS